MIPLHGTELGKEQEIKDMGNAEKADSCHAGDRMGSASRTVTVIGDADSDITESSEAESNEQRPIGIHFDGGMAPCGNGNRYK